MGGIAQSHHKFTGSHVVRAHRFAFSLTVAILVLASPNLQAQDAAKNAPPTVSPSPIEQTVSVPLLATAFVVMILCGALGGTAASLRKPGDCADRETEPYSLRLRRAILLGIVAALLVPLFLHLGHALVDANGIGGLIHAVLRGQDASSWLLLAGFSLIAAVYAERFLDAVSKAVIRQLQQEMREANATIGHLRESVREAQDDVVVAIKQQVKKEARLSKEGKVILSAMANIANTEIHHPSPEAISQETKLPVATVRAALNKELRPKYVKRLNDAQDGKERWRIRTAGKAFVEGLDDAQ
jgi:hypothetical protein